MKFLVSLIRVFVGIFFIISGLVKVVDPRGFSYKLEEYFAPDVLDLAFLIDYALPLATFFVIFEIILGFLLLMGLWRKFTLYSLLFVIVFFTFLTFYSAYFNKVTDCGCFGDALKFTPWQSFGKDIILLIGILFLFWERKYIYRWISKPYAYTFLSLSLLFSIFLAYRGIWHLPIKDFRAYAVGKNIVEGMKSAKELGLPQTKFKTQYTLRNTLNDKTLKISEEEYMGDSKYWGDQSIYEFIGTEDEVIQKGYEPPIHDFVIYCNNEDQTQKILNEEKVILVITPFPLEVNEEARNAVTTWLNVAVNKKIPQIHLSTNENPTFGLPPCLVDGITLKTMIRANPGVMILEKGIIKNKFHWRDLPSQL